MLKIRFENNDNTHKTLPHYKDRQICLEQATKNPKQCLAYLKNEFQLGQFSSNSHPLIGNIKSFIEDINQRWDVKDLGANKVSQYLSSILLSVSKLNSDSPDGYQPSLQKIGFFKSTRSSVCKQFLYLACSIKPQNRQKAQDYLDNNPCQTTQHPTLGSLNSLIDEINIMDGSSVWQVRDMGPNPITISLQKIINAIELKDNPIPKLTM